MALLAMTTTLPWAACTSTITEFSHSHCANQQGDAFCIALHGSVARYCSLPVDPHCINDAIDGCVETRPEDPVCYSPCGGRISLADAPDSFCGHDPVADGSSGEATTADQGNGASSVDASEFEDPTGTTYAPCGDGFVDDDEVCDDGINDGRYGGCSSDCRSFAPHCGDGILDERETCDIADTDTRFTCNHECQSPGTWLVTTDETIFASSPAPEGVRTTIWRGRLTAVFGGSETTIWEIDRESGETHALRNLDVDHSVMPIAGAVGHDDAGLLVVGGHWWRQGHRFDARLAPIWSYTEDEPGAADIAGFVGAAQAGDGVVLGGIDVRGNPDPVSSSYWAIAFSRAGEPQWNGVETIHGTQGYRGRDLRGIGEDRAVLLLDTPEGPAFRIYDEHGNVVKDALASEIDALCAGEGGFFLLASATSTLHGFDTDGESTFDVALSAEETNHGRFGCSVRPDGSPIVGTTRNGRLSVRVFEGPELLWTERHNVDCQFSTDPAVHIDEEHARVWILAGGATESGTRCVHASALAL